ncbi:hypothetical protein Sango_1267800 [Sesamum angolense]|uniref:SWIM-type domain-containing protein n=1 Tax=Sesamum angolense TaxID=2727404 RepID=A0AAE2BUD0_9LAMI|nr:hypothetical protein Sango_1267800 [Sesamum angolense]
MRIPRSSMYAQFLSRIYQKIGVDSNEYLLKVSAKHSCQYLDRIKETLLQITNDNALSFLLDPEAEFPMLKVYVDAEKNHVEPPPQMSQHWGEINPQMSQQWGEINPQMSQQWGEANPIGNSFANESDEASEPDEAEYPIPPEDGPDDVDINVMAETFAQGGAETSSEPALPNRTTQPTFYRSIPFFEQTFPETPADSIDVPNLRYAKFYNKFECRLDVRMLFKTKEELIEVVQDHSVRHARCEYYVTESSKTKWKVLCKHSTEGHVKCNPSYGIKHVIKNVKDQTGYDVPYQKAWYSLKKTREIVYGTCESSIRKLPKYLGAIQKYNSGTIVEWKHKAFQQSTDSYVLGYVFWAFKSCIDGFQFCRKIISVDDTHLYTKYKHKMLIAAAMDGNQQVLPLAFAIVDEETYPSWKWFLQQLSRHVIRRRRGMFLISDRHGRIIKAVREGPDFVSPHGVHRHSQQSASVVTRRQNGHGINTHVVKIANRECSCGKWNQFDIPCSHAQKVCGAYNISIASMVKDYYDLMAYNNTYSKHFEPVQSEDY